MTNKSCFPNAIELIDVLFDFVVTGAAKDYLRLDIGQITGDLAEKMPPLLSVFLETLTTFQLRHGIAFIVFQTEGTATKRMNGFF